MRVLEANKVNIQHALENRVNEYATKYIYSLLKLGERPTRKAIDDAGLGVTFCEYVRKGTFITSDMMQQVFVRDGFRTNAASPFAMGKIISNEMTSRRFIYNEKRVKWIFGRSEYAGDERVWAKICVALGFKIEMTISL